MASRPPARQTSNVRPAFSLLACWLAVLICPARGQEPARARLPTPQPGRPAVEDVLRAAGRYVAGYERTLTSIVAEEDYTQRLGRSAEALTRRLRSDLLLIFDGQFGYVGFRDVFEVDGRPVRDREQRLANLFLGRTRNPFERARRIAQEGARYNLNYDRVQIERTINMPLVALKFLRAQNQPRSSFSIDSRRAGEGGEVVLAFSERTRPRLIQSPDEQAARGAFWIDPASGRVSRSELNARTGGTRIDIHVAYARNPGLNMWLPATMEEEYLIAMTGALVGQARYSRFRQFQVRTETDIR
jgi:hypothetical protein